MLKIIKYEIVWSATLIGLFTVSPFVIMSLGFGVVKAWGFAIASAALVADGYLTKTCLMLKCKELNPTYNALKRKMRENYVFSLSRFVGILILVFVLVFFNEAVLLIFASSFFVGVVVNSITLSKVVSDNVRNNNISQPKSSECNQSLP